MFHRLGRTQVRQVLIQQMRANALRKLRDQMRAHNCRGGLQQVFTRLRQGCRNFSALLRLFRRQGAAEAHRLVRRQQSTGFGGASGGTFVGGSLFRRQLARRGFMHRGCRASHPLLSQCVKPEHQLSEGTLRLDPLRLNTRVGVCLRRNIFGRGDALMRKTGTQLHAHCYARTSQIQYERERGRERLRIKKTLRLSLLRTAQLAACRVHPHNAHRLTGSVQKFTVHIIGHIPRIHARLRAELKVLRRKRSGQRVQLHRNHGTAIRRIYGRIRGDTAPQISHRAGNRAQTLSAIMRNHRAGRLLRSLLSQHERAGALAELGARTGTSLCQ